MIVSISNRDRRPSPLPPLPSFPNCNSQRSRDLESWYIWSAIHCICRTSGDTDILRACLYVCVMCAFKCLFLRFYVSCALISVCVWAFCKYVSCALISVYLCVCKYVSCVLISVFVSMLHERLWVCVCVQKYVDMCAYKCVCVSISICWVCFMRAHKYVFISTSTCMNLIVGMSVCMRMNVFLYDWLYVHSQKRKFTYTICRVLVVCLHLSVCPRIYTYI